MEGKLITARIDVTRIIKELLFKGKKGTYCDLTIWINSEPDQYGNDCSIQQTTKKDEPKIFLGNGKTYKRSEVNEPKQSQPPESESQSDNGLPF